MSPNVKERRVHERRPATIDIQGTPESGGVVARMVTRNLSLGGLYCNSTTDFPEMTRLAVRLMLPLGDATDGGQPLDVEAVVVRRAELSGSNGNPRYDLALFFTNIEDGARKMLKRYLEDNP